jgi:hypothetical protein
MVHMMAAVTKTLIGILSTSLALCVFAWAQCPVDTVIIKGRVVENANAHSKVRVQLVFPKEQLGESGAVTVEDGAFQIPIEFMTTQSSIFTNRPKKCGRKPKTVVITLLENDQEFDHVSLDFAKSFQMADASAYTLRSEVVLNGRR